MQRIKRISRVSFLSTSIPMPAVRVVEPWEYWIACLLKPSAWVTGKKQCYCDYLENPPLEG
ncbi:MAG: hypothetical protein AMXMBFR82_42760 [Candidatus Hydrogenedentota bacterium]